MQLRNVYAVLALAVLALAPSAWAFDSKFNIDPNYNLGELPANGSALAHSGRSGSLFWADASAVLRANPAKLFAKAKDYDHYVQFGMPHLNASKVMEHDSDELIYTWTSMSYVGLQSEDYLEVRIHDAFDNRGTMGMEWQQAVPKPSWPTNNSKFYRFDGSFYVQPLDDGKVYVRYYLTNGVNMSLAGLLSGFIQSQLRKGAAEVIMKLAEAAQAQQ
jgi:ribosome-associated toxin RatA of RatAB toxin-antitoxin module